VRVFDLLTFECLRVCAVEDAQRRLRLGVDGFSCALVHHDSDGSIKLSASYGLFFVTSSYCC
jgi:hypothetical protein